MTLDVRQKSAYGPNGLAEVRLLKEKVKVIFEDGDIYELPREAWKDDRPGGEYIVGLNKERTDIMFVKPPGGKTWYVRFQEFKRGGGDIPEPYIQAGGRVMKNQKTGGTWVTEDEMRAKYVLNILEPGGMYDGLTLVGYIPYLFEQKIGTNQCELVGKQGQLSRTERFLRVTGFDFVNDTIQYSPNVLPQLERLLKEKSVVFSVVTNEKGFIEEMNEVPKIYLPEALR